MAVTLEEVAEQIRTGHLETAERNLSSIAQDDASQIEALFLRGYLKEQQYDHEGALADYEEVLERDPEHTESLFHAALLCDLRGEDDKALELYERCTAEEPVHVNALLNLAVLYEERHDIDAAARCVENVLRDFPAHVRARHLHRSVQASQRMIYDEKGLRDREARDAVLDMPVSDFELSVRSRNCLKQMNIATLGDLLETTEEELLAYKNFGETSLNEIKAMLSEKNLHLGQAMRDKTIDRDASAETEETDSSAVLHRPISELELSIRSRKCLQRLGITSLEELTKLSEADLMASKNFGLTSLGEINRQLAQCGLSLRDSD
jgi:DNA-directed RNA polymerase subunit alpha